MDDVSMVENNRLVRYDPAAIVPYPSSLDLKQVPLSAIGHKARSILSAKLNLRKILPTENGLPRDWRGILHCAKIAKTTMTPGDQLADISRREDPTARVLQLWNQDEESQASANFANLLAALEEIDRFDIADDIKEILEKDAKQYIENKHSIQSISQSNQQLLPASSEQHVLTRDDAENAYATYNAYILFVDEDIVFATEIIEKMENRGMKLCVKERDLLAGIPSEVEAVRRLITERCKHLIVICSPDFVKSRLNKFYLDYAQALGIEQGRRKIIPCVYEKCDLPNSLSYSTSLVYSPSRRLYNFWDKLYDAIRDRSQMSLASNRSTELTNVNQRQYDEIVNSHLVDSLSQSTNDENFNRTCQIMPPPPPMRKAVSEMNLSAASPTNCNLISAGNASHNSINSTNKKKKSLRKKIAELFRGNKKVPVT